MFAEWPQKSAKTSCSYPLYDVLCFYAVHIIVLQLRVGRQHARNIAKTTDRLGADIIVVPEEYEREMADSLFLGELCSFTFDREWVDVVSNLDGIQECTTQMYMASLAADCCSAATQMIIFDPETDFIVTPWLEQDGLALPQKGELYIGALINPPEPDSIKFFGENYHIIGQLERTNTSYDTCVFMTVETAQEIMDSEGWAAALVNQLLQPLIWFLR